MKNTDVYQSLTASCYKHMHSSKHNKKSPSCTFSINGYLARVREMKAKRTLSNKKASLTLNQIYRYNIFYAEALFTGASLKFQVDCKHIDAIVKLASCVSSTQQRTQSKADMEARS